MGDFGLRVEDDSDTETGFSPVEKVWSIPLYGVRKLFYFMSVFACKRIQYTSKLFGFRFDYEFRDQPRWNWLKDFSLPRYTLNRKQ